MFAVFELKHKEFHKNHSANCKFEALANNSNLLCIEFDRLYTLHRHNLLGHRFSVFESKRKEFHKNHSANYKFEVLPHNSNLLCIEFDQLYTLHQHNLLDHRFVFLD